MKTLLIFGAIVVGVFVLAVVFRPAPQEQQATVTTDSSIQIVGSSSYDFGTISMAKGEVVHEFKIKNTDVGEIKIGKMYTSCMCTVAWFMKGEIQKGPFGMPGHNYVPPVNESLAPGEEAIIKVIFDPNAHGPAGVGKIARVVTVEGNGSVLAEFNFAANVIP